MMINKSKMVEVDAVYLATIERDSFFLQCLDACGAPYTDVWDEALQMFESEVENND